MAVREPKRKSVSIQTRESVISELAGVDFYCPEVSGRRGDAERITDAQKADYIHIEKCPFCEQTHRHGGYGIRVAHCGSHIPETQHYCIVPPAGFLYFVQRENGGPIKIGFAEFVWSRLLLAFTWFDVTPRILSVKPVDERTDERKFHEKYRSCRRNREWFDPTDELVAEIQSIRIEHYQPRFVYMGEVIQKSPSAIDLIDIDELAKRLVKALKWNF